MQYKSYKFMLYRSVFAVTRVMRFYGSHSGTKVTKTSRLPCGRAAYSGTQKNGFDMQALAQPKITQKV